MPTWNRNKFKDGKLLRPVPKNKNIKVKLIGQIGHIENCTQTSIPTKSSASCSRKSANSSGREKQSFDKKIVFLQTSHNEVLSKLHQELEKVKIQNKALKFQLVMTREKEAKHAPQHHIDDDEKLDVCENVRKDFAEDNTLKGEIKELKKLLLDANSKNSYLTKIIEQLKQRPTFPRHSANSKTKTALRNKSSDHVMSQNTQQRSTSAKVTSKEMKFIYSDIYMETPNWLKEKQTQKIQNSQIVVFPKLEQASAKYAPRKGNSGSENQACKKVKEPISLPLLQGATGNRDMSLRQKRAKALHVQRQRSNKNITLNTAAATNNA